MIQRLVMVLLLILLPTFLKAQTAPAPNPLEGAWNVSVNGNFSSISNAPTNNGVLISTALRMSTHLNIRADTYLLQAPSVTVALGGPEYRFSLARLVKNSTGAVNTKNTEVFINAGFGDAHSSAIVSQSGATVTTTSRSKFAVGVGGGFDICVSSSVCIRPLDIKYMHSSMLTHGEALVGNHLNFAAGIGLRL